ncbi:MAG: PIN domain-containing protein [Spirochaetota bacterium]
MSILVDSSVWIDYFRGGNQSAPLDLLLENNSICTCGLILAEILPFLIVRNQKKLVSLMHTIPNVACTPDWKRITRYQAQCLKKGINGIGIPDLIIAQTALDNECTLFSLDNHFDMIQKVIPLRLFK